MRIRIEARDLPGRDRGPHRDIHVGVQRRGRNDDILEPVPADAVTASWEFEVTPVPGTDGIDVRGPYVHGGPGARFLYLSWGTLSTGTFSMFGRSKLLLSAIDGPTMAAAVGSGTLVGRVGLVDERGRLRMASIRPPAIVWSAQ
jgi:hypothetical protein